MSSISEQLPKAIHVLLVSTKADLSGAPLHVLELAKGLHSHGVKVTAVFGEHGEVGSELESLGITVYVIESIKSAISPRLDVQALRELGRLVSALKPDLIHAHSSKAGMISRMVAWKQSIPSVFTIHGWGFGPGRKKLIALYVRTVEWLLKPITTGYIAVSEADKKLGIERLGIPTRKISCIHNGVPDNAKPFQVRPGTRLIMVARNDYPKDYQSLIKAAGSLSVQVSCVGRDTDTEAFRMMAAEAIGDGCAEIDFMGMRSDVANLLAASNIFVLSSRFEGLPLSIIEAMRAGMPIIASDVGGCAELVKDGINGYLVAPGDVDALREAIQKLISDHDLQQAMGLASRAFYEANFNSDRMTAKTIAVYRHILQDLEK